MGPLAYTHLLLGSCSVAANSIVIISVYRFEFLQTRSNMYILSLACVDTCAGLVELCFGLYLESSVKPWFNTNKVACVALFNVFYFTKTCSIAHMFLIALDRFLFISKPFWYAREVTEQRVRIAFLCGWLGSLLFGSVVWFINK